MTSMHKESYECVVSDLDLTATPPTQTSVESVVEHIPIHTLTHGAPIEFVSYGAGDHYRDLSDVHLGLKCRVRKNKNEDLDANINVAIINYLINTLFCQIDIIMNGKKNNAISSFTCLESHLRSFVKFWERSQINSLGNIRI